jgi:hypothetical protein
LRQPKFLDASTCLPQNKNFAVATGPRTHQDEEKAMKLCRLRMKFFVRLLALVAFDALAICSPLAAITIGQVDDFEDGSTQNWFGAFPVNVPDAGPNGTGDNALLAAASGNSSGAAGKLVIFNRGFQWDGNWTSAGLVQVAMDMRNPNTFALSMRLGIAGPDGVSGFGSGDSYVSTNAISVPADNAWHSLTFDVLAEDFTPVGGQITPNIGAALAGVTHFRILHNSAVSFLGEAIDADFYVDNIRPIAAPTAVPGDYNRNGVVDAADYVVWRKTLSQSVPNGSGADGTGPGGTPDGLVNNLDYDFWRSRFGSTSPGAGSALGAAAVPEPAAWALLLGFAPAVFSRGRYRKKAVVGFFACLPLSISPCL